MTNREKLLNTNIYDLLMEMNNFIITDCNSCVLEALEQKRIDCPCYSCEKRIARPCYSCENCIQKYLNKEV